jgi:hypothetical protein
VKRIGGTRTAAEFLGLAPDLAMLLDAQAPVGAQALPQRMRAVIMKNMISNNTLREATSQSRGITSIVDGAISGACPA